MSNPHDHDIIPLDLVHDDQRGASDHQFARAGLDAGPSDVRVIEQTMDRLVNSAGHARGSRGIDRVKVIKPLVEINDRQIKPPEPHRLGFGLAIDSAARRFRCAETSA